MEPVKQARNVITADMDRMQMRVILQSLGKISPWKIDLQLLYNTSLHTVIVVAEILSSNLQKLYEA